MTLEAGGAAAAWAERVRANRDQVDRFREVPDGQDFYAPVTSLFRSDPRRDDEPVLDRLRMLARPGDAWLDIGAGAGRYALPLALVVREVVALDPSAGMLAALRDQMAEHGIANIRIVEGRWPPDRELAEAIGPMPLADVALIAHVGYDVEAIEPFLDAMEAAVRRRCHAVLMERPPASVADPFWPPVHGEERVCLPALPEFVAVLGERGREPEVELMVRDPRTFDTREELTGFLRRQLWIAEGGDKWRRFEQALDDLIVERDGGVGLVGQAPATVGLVSWSAD